MRELKKHNYQYPGSSGVSFDMSIGRSTFGLDRIDRNDMSLNYYIFNNDTLTTSAYWGGILHPNGKIYFIPYSELSVCEIDPYIRNSVFFGDVSGSTKWKCGFLGPDDKIYCIPSNYTFIGIIDTVSKTIDVSSFPLKDQDGVPITTSFGPGCYGPDGKYYLSPLDSSDSSIGCIDPINRTITVPMQVSVTSNYKSGAVLGPDGLIYFIPRDGTGVIVYDVWKNSITSFNTVSNGYGTFGYNGGVLAPNGCIYCAPSSADKILEIDTYTKKSRTVGSYTNGGTLAFSQAIYGPDDCIYFIPLSSSKIVKLDYKTGITTEIETGLVGSKWGPGCFDENGKFWSSTWGGDSILVLDFQQKLKMDHILYHQGI